LKAHLLGIRRLGRGNGSGKRPHIAEKFGGVDGMVDVMHEPSVGRRIAIAIVIISSALLSRLSATFSVSAARFSAAIVRRIAISFSGVSSVA
jgi:hypothetical protein